MTDPGLNDVRALLEIRDLLLPVATPIGMNMRSASRNGSPNAWERFERY